MNFERFRFSAGIEVINVHTKGVSEALTEVISGRADCYFALVFQAKRMVEGGKVVALATGSPKRSGLMPDVPTTLELGYPELGLQLLGRRDGAVEDAARDRRQAATPTSPPLVQLARDQRGDPQARLRPAADDGARSSRR